MGFITWLLGLFKKKIAISNQPVLSYREQLKKDIAEGYLSKAEEKLVDEVCDKAEAYDKLIIPHPKEKYYNEKYPKTVIYYNGRYIISYGKYSIDVRDFFTNPDSDELRKIVRKWDGKTDDEKALACQIWVKNAITYVSDKSARDLSEYWQYPQETLFLKTGDCDDGAILMANLMLASGIPYWKIRLNAGNVYEPNSTYLGGHAWLNYYYEKGDKWVSMDWCIVDNKRTKINTYCGKSKRPSKIKEGDELLAYNEGKIVKTKVKKVFKREVNNLIKIEFSHDEKKRRYNPYIIITPDHPIYADENWIKAGELKVNQKIYHIKNVLDFKRRIISPEHARKIAETKRLNGDYETLRRRQITNNIAKRPEVRAKLRKNNAMKRRRVMIKAYKAHEKRPTKPEEFFIQFIKENNLPIKYIGDGSFWINRMNPDFKVIGEKKVIEVIDSNYPFRDYKEYIKKRKENYGKCGFQCKFIDIDSKHHPKFRSDISDLSKFIFNGAKILSIRKINRKEIVYNYYCEPYNNYFVNGILVHNCFYPKLTPLKDRPDYKDEIIYGKGEVWFSWNQNYSFAKSTAKIKSSLKQLNIKIK